MVYESRVTWATSVPILVFLGLSFLELGQMYATDRRQTDRRQIKASLNASALWGGGIIKVAHFLRHGVVWTHAKFGRCRWAYIRGVDNRSISLSLSLSTFFSVHKSNCSFFIFLLCTRPYDRGH